MTHQQFIDTWNNKFLERIDGNSPNQCFDLAVAYCEDVLGMPRAIFAGLMYAYQIFTQPTVNTGSRFDFIINTPWSVPKQGDIIVWSNKYGPAGHVAVVHTADVNKFTAFSQNDPTGKPCILKEYGYTNVLGYLRALTNTSTDELQKQIVDLKATIERQNTDLKAKDQQIREINADWGHKLADQATACQAMINNTRNKTIEEVLNVVNNLKK